MQKADFIVVQIQLRRGTECQQRRQGVPPAVPLLGWREGLRFWSTGRMDRRHHTETRGTVRSSFATGMALGFGVKQAPHPQHRHSGAGQAAALCARSHRPTALGAGPGALGLHSTLTPSFRNNIKNDIFYFLPINERVTVNQHFDSRP